MKTEELEENLRKCPFSPDIQRLKVKNRLVSVGHSPKFGYSAKHKQISAEEFLNAIGGLR